MILFFIISFIGAASAADDALLNETTLKSTNSGDAISPMLSNDFTDDGSLQSNDDNEMLSATHDVSGNTFNDISNLINSGNVNDGDIIYLGNKDFTASDNLITVNKKLTILGGSSDNPDGFSTLNGNNNKAIFKLNVA